MSDALGRGITVTEIAAMDQPVDVTPETTAAFVGRTLRGPLNTPVLVKNVGEFRRRFGDSWPESGMGPAVHDFFEHGGTRLYIVRVANNARGAMICLPAEGSALVLRAVEPGSAETLRAAVDYDGVESDDLFNLTLQRVDSNTGHVLDQEYFQRVSYLKDSEQYVVDALLTSDMARVESPLPTHRPESTVGLEHGIGVEYVEASQAGADGNALSDYDLVGSRAASTGIFALDNVERFDVLYLPPVADGVDAGPTAALAAELYCRQRGALLITDPRPEWEDAEEAVAGLRGLGYASPYMLGYFPRIRDSRHPDSPPRPAGGAIAGLLAKLDALHGPWETLDQQGLGLKRHYRPAISLDEEDQVLLERSGLNSLVVDGTHRLRVSGDRTLARGTEPHRRQTKLPVQRLCLALNHAIDAATRWAVFERPGPRLAELVQAQVSASFIALFEHGALADANFDVACNVERAAGNGPHAIELLLSFTPAGCRYPLSFTLHQTVAGCRVTSTAFAPVHREPRPLTPPLVTPTAFA
ncbi:MAG: hypothetical protein QNI96_15135 [Woeseiaceae bacterium]|nr:hypothetical protein [Woeseiaceae bacterium]